MKKIVVITSLVFFFFLIEFFLFNLIGRWFMPDMLLLLIIFFNLYLGIRYSIFAAVCAGLLKDSFFANIFGINLVSYVVCAYMLTILKRYIYHAGSKSSRLILVFFIVTLNAVLHYVLLIKFGAVDIVQSLKHVVFPEITTTVIIATTVFYQLKKCVLKLSV